MINLYSGTPGSGKSLHLAERVYNRLRFHNDVVVGNFDVNVNAIKKHKGHYLFMDNMNLTPERLIWLSRNYSAYLGRRLKEGEILLIIDECQILFNSREWQNSDRNAWLSFYTQHRKYGYEIILITQFDRMIDRQIRALIEYEYIHRKVNNFGLSGAILGILFGGALFVTVKMWYPMRERLGAEFFVCKKKYFSIYDTYYIFGTDTLGVGHGVPTDNVPVPKKYKQILGKVKKILYVQKL